MEYRLEEIADVIMGQSPKSEFYNNEGEGMPFLQGNRTFGRRFPTFDTYTTKVTKKAKAGDVIMSVRAPVGDLNITPIDMCLGRGVCGIRMKNGKQDFLFYLMKYNMQKLLNKQSGTVFGSVNRKDINGLIVEVPNEETQDKIASFLGEIDRKIENNEAINRNLSEQAKAIFLEELVQISEIPEGWEEGSLTDIADYLNGLAMQKFRPEEDEVGLPVLKIKDLRLGSCDASNEYCSPNIKSEYIVEDGDVIFSWSGSLLVDLWCGGECGLNQHLFKVTSKVYDKWFYYSWTQYHLERFIAIAAAKATTMGHIKRGDLSSAEVLIPSAEDYERIGSILKPMYELIISNKIENRNLSKTRDVILLKLMSGEIDVSELKI